MDLFGNHVLGSENAPFSVRDPLTFKSNSNHSKPTQTMKKQSPSYHGEPGGMYTSNPPPSESTTIDLLQNTLPFLGFLTYVSRAQQYYGPCDYSITTTHADFGLLSLPIFYVYKTALCCLLVCGAHYIPRRTCPRHILLLGYETILTRLKSYQL